MIRIPVDFNAMNREGTHVWINTTVYPELVDLLKPGMRVILYEAHDIQIEAVIEVEEDESGTVRWWGVVDLSTRMDLA